MFSDSKILDEIKVSSRSENGQNLTKQLWQHF